jgi:PAS domain S-box-containing protein
MPIHKKIIFIVGAGMLVIMTAVVLSELNVLTAFSSITGEVERTSREMRQIEDISAAIAGMDANLHDAVSTGDERYRRDYEADRTTLHRLLDDFEKSNVQLDDRRLVVSLRADVAAFEEKADRLLAFKDPLPKDRLLAGRLMKEADGLTERITREIEKHFREEQTLQLAKLPDYTSLQQKKVLLFSTALLIMTVGFLSAFGFYLHRKIAAPLRALWKGASEISRGNLDYQMRLSGTSDVAQLAERFNEMALKLKASYTDLEKKLLERTNELAAIDAVALTLSKAGNLRDMLSRSLDKIMENMAGLEPRGGVFLSEPDGETLRLVAHKGLPPQFIEQEGTIRMGECLCGMVAQSGEILYSQKGCADPRHTRDGDAFSHAHIVIPIKSRGIVFGVVFLYPQKEFSPRPSDLQMLDTIGTQLGMAVENLRFYAEVKESSEKFWDLFENSRDILFTMDDSGVLTAVNREAEIFSGYGKTELVGKSVLDFLTPEGAEWARRMLGGEGVTATQVIEFEVIKRDGSRAFIEVSARRLSRQGAPAGYQISARDMTEQKLIREKLLRAERLGAIGEIVIAVRHEINNPLTTVIGNIELMIERYGEQDKDLASRLQAVLNNALRIAEIVKQLQAIKRDKVVEYVRGVTMTDLKQE